MRKLHEEYAVGEQQHQDDFSQISGNDRGYS